MLTGSFETGPTPDSSSAGSECSMPDPQVPVSNERRVSNADFMDAHNQAGFAPPAQYPAKKLLAWTS